MRKAPLFSFFSFLSLRLGRIYLYKNLSYKDNLLTSWTRLGELDSFWRNSVYIRNCNYSATPSYSWVQPGTFMAAGLPLLGPPQNNSICSLLFIAFHLCITCFCRQIVSDDYGKSKKKHWKGRTLRKSRTIYVTLAATAKIFQRRWDHTKIQPLCNTGELLEVCPKCWESIFC